MGVNKTLQLDSASFVAKWRIAGFTAAAEVNQLFFGYGELDRALTAAVRFIAEWQVL